MPLFYMLKLKTSIFYWNMLFREVYIYIYSLFFFLKMFFLFFCLIRNGAQAQKKRERRVAMTMEIATAEFLKTNLPSYGQSYLGFSCCPCCLSLAYRCCVTRLKAILPQTRADQKSVPWHWKTNNRKREGPPRGGHCCSTEGQQLLLNSEKLQVDIIAPSTKELR
jgi:hypothetical protein